MTSSHDGYTHMTNLVQDLAADTSVNENLRNRLSNLYTAMNGSSVTLGHGDMMLIAQALPFVASNKQPANA